jgi:hypothetical protein
MEARVLAMQAATELLAAPAEDQIRRLRAIYGRDLGEFSNIDEIALEFSDIVLLRDTMLQAGEISHEQHQCLGDLDRALARISGNRCAALWTVEALRTDERWDDIRAKALECLKTFER